ncbi:hypothetical protein STEG23_032960 [Scotinomys teguina]
MCSAAYSPSLLLCLPPCVLRLTEVQLIPPALLIDVQLFIEPLTSLYLHTVYTYPTTFSSFCEHQLAASSVDLTGEEIVMIQVSHCDLDAPYSQNPLLFDWTIGAQPLSIKVFCEKIQIGYQESIMAPKQTSQHNLALKATLIDCGSMHLLPSVIDEKFCDDRLFTELHHASGWLFQLSLEVLPPLMFPMTVTPLGWDQDCSLKIREPEVPAPFWFLDPGGWSKTAAVSLYFIFPRICTLSLKISNRFISIAVNKIQVQVDPRPQYKTSYTEPDRKEGTCESPIENGQETDKFPGTPTNLPTRVNHPAMDNAL